MTLITSYALLYCERIICLVFAAFSVKRSLFKSCPATLTLA